MEVVLKKMGDNTGFIVPPGVLEELGLSAGQVMTATIEHGRVILEPKHRYRLADLIARCDLNAPVPADIAAWDEAPAVGREAL